jgi:hypothetical protein
MRIIILLAISLLLLASCASNSEYVLYRMGPDTFNSRDGVFERGICSVNQSSIVIRLSLSETQKTQLLNLAKQDIKIGNESLDYIDRICVSSSPHEINIVRGESTISSTCLSFLSVEDNKLEDFIYSLPEIQNLPKSNCRYY